jgi:hypothetical protein
MSSKAGSFEQHTPVVSLVGVSLNYGKTRARWRDAGYSL